MDGDDGNWMEELLRSIWLRSGEGLARSNGILDWRLPKAEAGTAISSVDGDVC